MPCTDYGRQTTRLEAESDINERFAVYDRREHGRDKYSDDLNARLDYVESLMPDGGGKKGRVPPAPAARVVKPDNDPQTRLHRVTALLCGVCRSYPNAIGGVDGLQEWWTAHQEDDRRRIEDARVTGLAKLSADEREALGLEHGT